MPCSCNIEPMSSGDATQPKEVSFGGWMGSMWLYTGLRFGLFFALWGIVLLTGVGTLLAAIIALVLSVPLSLVLLAKPRRPVRRAARGAGGGPSVGAGTRCLRSSTLKATTRTTDPADHAVDGARCFGGDSSGRPKIEVQAAGTKQMRTRTIHHQNGMWGFKETG